MFCEGCEFYINSRCTKRECVYVEDLLAEVEYEEVLYEICHPTEDTVTVKGDEQDE